MEVLSRKGKRKFHSDGYCYLFDRVSACKTKEFWRCEQKNSGCKKRIHTSNGVIVQEINNHCHEGNAAKVEADIIRSRIKIRAGETTEQTSEIIKNCLEEANLSRDVQGALPKTAALKRMIRRKRNEMNAATLAQFKVEDLIIPEESKLYDANGQNILVANNNLEAQGSSQFGGEENIHEVRGHTRASSGSREFLEATKRDALKLLEKELEKLLATASPNEKEKIQKEFAGFTTLFGRFLEETGPSVDWDKIEKLPNDAVRDYNTLETPTEDTVHNMLSKLVVVKLNGGLGTSMGCHGPKSVIAVRNDLTFLDLTVQQIEHLNKRYNVNVPLILMNSFNTDEDTAKVIRKYKNLQVEIHTFNQSCYPRINRDTLMPITRKIDIHNDLESWYPPGHGDFYHSLRNSGLLKKFIEQGREYCFISNIDNLGATVDLNILNLLLNPKDKVQHEFVMEVTDKTRADVKGGTLIQYENKLRLLEIAQVPKEHVDDFKSVKTFKFFNTNNLWAKLDAIERVLTEDSLNLEIIINNKTLNNGLNVIQLETAVGAAMKFFEGGIGINVPRSRFLPVKKTSDLLLVMSNLYSLKNGSLVMSPQRMFPTTPLVKLGDNHFAKVKDFLGRFANIPDLIELDHLTVSGDVTFGRGVSLKGTVIIIANHGDRIDIPSGANLENKIVSGNMRILDH